MGMKRTLHFESLTDGFVYPVVDSVNDKGEATQQRFFVEKMAKKRLPVLDGKPGETLPAFRLAKKPEVFSPHDKFDEDVLKDADGKWLFPTERWKKEQEKRLGKRNDSAARAESQAKSLAATQVVDGLARFLASPAKAEKAEKQTTQIERGPPNKPGDAPGGGKS